MADLKLKTIIGLSDRLTGPLRGLAGRVTAITGRLGTAASRATLPLAAATTAAAAATYKLVSSTAAANDHLAKSARRTGVTAQAYAELQHAANLAGVSQAEFDKALEGFNRRVGEAKLETGSFYSLLRKGDRDLLRQVQSTTSTSEALDLVLESMAGMTDTSRRAAFAQAAFGRSGQKMALLTENGTEALKDARSEFARYFGTIDDDALSRSESFVDSQARLELTMSGLKATIGNALLPVLEPLIKRLTAWTVANKDLIATRVERFARGLVRALTSVPWGKISDGFARVAKGGARLIDMLGGVENIAPIAAALLGTTLAGGLISLLGPLGAVAAAVVGVVAVWDDMPPAVTKAVDAIKRAMPGVKAAIQSVIGFLAKAINNVTHLIELLEKQSRLEEYNDRIVRVSAGERFGRAAQAVNPGQMGLGDLFDAVTSGGKSVGRKFATVYAAEERKAARERAPAAASRTANLLSPLVRGGIVSPQKAEMMVRLEVEAKGGAKAAVKRSSTKSTPGLKVGTRAVGVTP